MKNSHGETPLYECSTKLSAVAMGRMPADTVIRNANLINVCTHEIQPGTDVAISSGRIALVGDAAHCTGDNTKIIDAGGKYICPGFIDGHMHIESSMLSVSEYSKAVMPHGTTRIVPDPHEMCNVLGTGGIKYMIEESRNTPLKTMFAMPSCVPAVPGFEDTGSEIKASDVREMMKMDEIEALGEMMNFPGVLNSDSEVHNIIGETLKAGKTVTGHYSIPDTGMGLNAYIAAGINDCHESTRAEDALAKMRLGMYAMMREGSAWRDLETISKSLTETGIDSRFAVLVSDDSHPATLLYKGHMDHIIRQAVKFGIDPVTAIQMATINCAQCFGIAAETGSVTPGKTADIVMFSSLEKIDVCMTMINGTVVAENGKTICDIPQYKYPPTAVHTVNIGEDITESSFIIPCSEKEAEINVIEIIPGRTSTVATKAVIRSDKGNLVSDTDRDVLKATVFERHNATGRKGFGFIKGFGIRNGAVATTVAHDAHNLLVIGSDDRNMAVAAKALQKADGGLAVVKDGKVTAIVNLPIAGLMSDKSVYEVESEVLKLKSSWKELGCTIPSPFMTMSILSLACLPELRLTNRGLVDCTKFEFVPLFTEQG